MPKLRQSSTVPVLPPASGRTGSSRSGSHAVLAPGETLEKLVTENEHLRQQLHSEKQKFQTMYVKDLFKSPARRRLEPMKQLIVDQSETSSLLATEKLVKQQVTELVEERAKVEAIVHERRLLDMTAAEVRLQQLEEQLAMAEGDAADANDREETYLMMEGRLQDLVTEDQQRLNTIQRVIDESKLRLSQGMNVSREGEAELGEAEAALAVLRHTLHEERASQNKMMEERRAMVGDMVKYSQERSERQKHHQDKLLASRGDLDAEGEKNLRVAAGTMDALRAINESGAKATFSFEDKCRRAFLKIEGITGAKDLQEVLFIVLSKSELASQLQKRVAGIEQRRTELEEQKLSFEEERTKEHFGGENVSELKDQIGEVRQRLAGQEQRQRELSSSLASTMAMLQTSRLTWENVHKLLEPGIEVDDPRRRRRQPEGSGAQNAAIDRLLADAEERSTQQTTQQGVHRATSKESSGNEGDVDLSLLPKELADLPTMVEEIGQRGARLLEMIAQIEASARAAKARRRAAAAAGEPDDEPNVVSPGGSSIFSLAKQQRSPTGGSKGFGADGAGEPSAAPLTGKSSKGGKVERVFSKQEAILKEALPSNNIRVMPFELAELLLQAREETPVTDEATGKRASAAAKAAAEKETKDKDKEPPVKRTSFQLAAIDDESELISREDMKAAAERLARKAARAALRGGKTVAPAPAAAAPSKGQGRS